MSDLAPQSDFSLRADTRTGTAPTLDAQATLIEQWGAVEDAARVVAMLAGRPTPVDDPYGTARIGLLARSHPDRLDATSSALSDLVATMRAGLDALLAVQGTATDTHPAATRLWSEYERGRAEVLAEAASALGC